MIARMSCRATAAATASVSAMSPVTQGIPASCSSLISRRGRRRSSDRSNATAGTPALVNSASAQLPMQPPAPVTRTGPSKLALSTGKRVRSMYCLPTEGPTLCVPIRPAKAQCSERGKSRLALVRGPESRPAQHPLDWRWRAGGLRLAGRAHEDDAERAVSAGLQLVDEVGSARRLTSRCGSRRGSGIATGRVVVGDLIGEGASREEAVVGEVPNLAARLQALAEPGIGGNQSGDAPFGWAELFELDDLGPQRLKGLRRRSRSGGSRARAERRAASRHARPRVSRRWSDARRRSPCCCAAGGRRGMAMAKSCCSRASPGSASRDLCGKCATVLPRSRTSGCSTSARRIIRPAPCIR